MAVAGQPTAAGKHCNIVAVGDDAQAIYRFRGASFGSFTIFLEKFAGVAKGDSISAARYVRPLVENCPQKHLFAYVWGLRGGPHASMTFGNVMHNTIREFLGALRKGRPLPPFEEVETIFRREWNSQDLRIATRKSVTRRTASNSCVRFTLRAWRRRRIFWRRKRRSRWSWKTMCG